MAAKKKPTKGAKGLTKAEIAKIKGVLQMQRARLTGDYDSMKEDVLRSGDQDFSIDHMADQASDSFDQDFNLGLIENVGRTIAEIDAALERMEKGIYGNCKACGVIIPPARLNYLPWVKYCVSCQERSEKGILDENASPEEEE